MSKDQTVGLVDALRSLRIELEKARRESALSEISMPVEKAVVELTMVLETSADGKAGFKIPIVDLELGVGGTVGRSQTHTLTVELGPATDRQGRAVRVEDRSAELLD